MKTSLNIRLLLSALSALSALGAPAAAQLQTPPTITILETERSVGALVRVDGDNFFDESTTTEGEFFSDRFSYSNSGQWGSQGEAWGSQATVFSSFSLRGKGSAYGKAVLGGGQDAQVRVSGSSELFVSFTVPVDAPFTLSGSFPQCSEEPCDSCAFASTTVSFAGIDANGTGFYFLDSSCGDSPVFGFSGIAKADTTLTFAIESRSSPESSDFLDLLGEGTAEFEFVLDFGDRDGDGLLDAWETSGIDFPGSGVELNLPLLGANPDRVDIFVELDRMAGVPFEQEAVNRVIQAFDRAPVPNLVGPAGITLHVILDSDQLGSSYLKQPPGGRLPDEYYNLKNAHFGSESERLHPLWADIRKARLRIFRYVVWADEFRIIDTDCTNDESAISGIAEAIPSNDFVVSAGYLSRVYNDARADATPDDLVNAMAGTFMHELGHTLGLKHGGGPQDGPSYKPNYLSVMNYAFQKPFPKSTTQGTHAREAFFLDYSRQALTSLDENGLVETVGLAGPLGRKILFNSAPEEALRSRLTLSLLGSTGIDWNNQSAIENDPIALDITRFRRRKGNDCGNVPIPPEYDWLDSFSDWERLLYDLSAEGLADDRAAWPGSRPAEIGLDEDSFFEILDADWIDLSPFTVLFADDFERATTSAWSAGRR